MLKSVLIYYTDHNQNKKTINASIQNLNIGLKRFNKIIIDYIAKNNNIRKQEYNWYVTNCILDKNIQKYNSLKDIFLEQNIVSLECNQILKQEYLHPLFEDNKKRIHIKMLTGSILNIDIDLENTVEYLQEYIESLEMIPKCQQRLIFNGKQLEYHKKLINYDIQDKSTLHLVLRLRGGMFMQTTSGNCDYSKLENIDFSFDEYVLEDDE
jgi:hypothetical protein